MNIQTFFGDATTCTFKHKSPDFNDWCHYVVKNKKLSHLVFNRQTHSAIGNLITEIKNLNPVSIFENNGDFLITNKPGVALGVLTADCLPIIFYDSKNQVIAIVHAGWRGTIANICKQTIQRMQKKYKSNVKDFYIWLGAGARHCCYQVQPDFMNHLKKISDQNFIEKRNDKLFFDNTKLNIAQLLSLGILQEQINTTRNVCTICNQQFHSYRRCQDKANYQTQATIVWLPI